MPSGSPNATYGMIRPGQVLNSPSARSIVNSGVTSPITGISASAMTTKFAVAQPVLWRGVMAAISGSPLSDVRAGGRGAEALDEQERDDRDADEDQDRDCRPDAQVQRVEQVVIAEDRDRPGAVGAQGEDVDVVENPERVQCPEQQGDQDRRLHQRQRDLREALPARSAVHLRGLLQVFGYQRQAGQQQQRHERRGLPDLGDDDDDDGLELIGQRRAVVEYRGQVALAWRPRVLPAVGGGHRHDPVRDERGGADQAPAEYRPVQDVGQQEAEHQRGGPREERDDHGYIQRMPPVRGAEHRAVVGEPDELFGLREGQVVALQRQVDGVYDGVGGDRDHHDNRRRDQREAQPALGPRAFR